MNFLWFFIPDYYRIVEDKKNYAIDCLFSVLYKGCMLYCVNLIWKQSKPNDKQMILSTHQRALSMRYAALTNEYSVARKQWIITNSSQYFIKKTKIELWWKENDLYQEENESGA